MPPEVFEAYIYETPFINMIVAAVEVYPTECMGVLLGYRAWHSFDGTRRAIVEQAIPYQTAKRTRDSVTVRAKHEFRCKDMLYKLSSLEPIGHFHSHPKSIPELSHDDEGEINTGDTEIVIAVSKRAEDRPWKYYIRKKELAGVFGDFRFDIAAHTCNRYGEIEKIPLACPFALGIGSKYMDVTVPFPDY